MPRPTVAAARPEILGAFRLDVWGAIDYIRLRQRVPFKLQVKGSGRKSESRRLATAAFAFHISADNLTCLWVGYAAFGKLTR